MLLILIFIIYIQYVNDVEGFIDKDCTTLKDCTSCADADGCSWCPKKSTCVYTKKIKSTDECNQSNVIGASEQCKVHSKLDPLADSVYDGSIKNMSIYDTPIYKNNINSDLPPAIFTTQDKNYSNEDVVSNINKMREDIKNLKMELPNIISSSIGNNVQPMIKSLLSNTQGFEDMNPLKRTLRGI